MRFYVNHDCIGCGMCAETCPEVFFMTEGGTARAASGDVGEPHREAAEEALENCPVDAIRRDD